MPDTNQAKPAGSLGTFAGVFTPSILTILGIILFRRMGYVLGEAGLVQALVIMLIANTISILTTFSLAAIATNLKVKGGGDYYLISRTLGLEFGGAIGIVLFLAQSVSIAFYCIGFGEVVAGLLPMESIDFSNHDNSGDIVKKIQAAIKIRKEAQAARIKALKEKAKLDETSKKAKEQGIKTKPIPKTDVDDKT